MGVTRTVNTRTLPVQPKQNYGFSPGSAIPCLKAGCKDGGQKSGKLLRKINIKKVFGFLKRNFRVYNTSSFKNVRSVQGLFSPRKTSERLSGLRRAPTKAGSGTGTLYAHQHQPSALLEIRRLRFLKGNSQECIHLTGTTQSCCSIYLVTFLFKYFFKNNFLPLKLSKNIYIPRQLNNFKMVCNRKNYTWIWCILAFMEQNCLLSHMWLVNSVMISA